MFGLFGVALSKRCAEKNVGQMVTKLYRTVGDKILYLYSLLQFGAVQKCANLVDLNKMLQNEHVLANICFDIADREIILKNHIFRFWHTPDINIKL